MKLTVNQKSAFVANGGRPFDASRPSVMFVHGAGMDHTVWVLPMRYFARHGYNVLAVDLPGHGRSGGHALRSIEQMADWLVALLEAAGLERTAMVGHSMGSLVTLEAAAGYPGRVRALVLLGTSAPMRVSEVLLNAAQANDPAALDMLTIWGHGHWTQVGGNPSIGMWMLGCGTRLLERAAPGVIYADLSACNNYDGGAAAARRLSCPTTLILGSKDIMTPPRAAQALADNVGQARTILLDGCGHALMAERPDDVLDTLIECV